MAIGVRSDITAFVDDGGLAGSKIEDRQIARAAEISTELIGV
jgi:hypothetical protein